MSGEPGAGSAPSTKGATAAGAATPAEADLLFTLVRDRYGSRLTPDQLEAVRQGVATIVEEMRTLRAVPLRNSDAPLLPRPTDA